MKDEAKKKLSKEDQDSRMSVLKEIMKDMDGLMSNDLDEKKKMKVSVLSDSKAGLAKGLDKAEDMMGGEDCAVYPKFGSDQEAGALMDEDSYEEDSSMIPDESLTSQELDEKIKKLLSLKEQKSVKAPF
jgi:hypothetical protein